MDIQKMKERLHYCAETGVFTWIKGTPKVQGKKAGSLRKGYVRIKVDGRVYWAHRLALQFHNVHIPEGHQVDHINGNRGDNRFLNLRVVTRRENLRNKCRPTHNKSGHMGISETTSGKWMVRTHLNNEQQYHGTFNTIDAAIIARDKAYKHLGLHENHGRG